MYRQCPRWPHIPLKLFCSDFRIVLKRTLVLLAANLYFPPITSNAWTSNPYSRQRRRQHINLGLCLPASPARLRVSQGRTALRSVAHSAMRPHRGVAPRPPVCPPREHVPPRPLRQIALWSVLRGKTILPLHPSSASGRAVCLLGSGKPTLKTHTHECGSISSGWPPNQPASRIAKLFGEGGGFCRKVSGSSSLSLILALHRAKTKTRFGTDDS